MKSLEQLDLNRQGPFPHRKGLGEGGDVPCSSKEMRAQEETASSHGEMALPHQEVDVGFQSPCAETFLI